MKLNNLVVAISIPIILLPLGYSVVSSVVTAGTQSTEPLLQYPDEEHGSECVLGMDREYMRFHHMDLLKGSRDQVVREGKREFVCDGRKGEIRFDGCWECHTSRERFCNVCHEAVNLNLGCFRCHYDPDLQ